MPTATARAARLNATAVCRSQACDQGTCGYQNGDGPCSGGAQCLSSRCDATSSTCVVCQSDSQCSDGRFCDSGSGTCKKRRDNGLPCAREAQCVSSQCDDDEHCGLVDNEICTKALECRSGVCSQHICGVEQSDAGMPNDDAGAPDASVPSSTDDAGVPDASVEDAPDASMPTEDGEPTDTPKAKPPTRTGRLAGGGGHFGCSTAPASTPAGNPAPWLALLGLALVRRARRRVGG